MTDIKINIVDHNKAPKLEVGQVRYSENGDIIIIGINGENDLTYMSLSGNDRFFCSSISVNESVIRQGYPFVAQSTDIKINER